MLKISRTRSVFINPFVLVSILLALSRCAGKEEVPLFRFIDHIGQKNVISSPLKEIYPNPSPKILEGSPSLAELFNNFPLSDLGSGENPFSVKKKLSVGNLEFNSLAAMPESHFAVPSEIPLGSVLEFGCALRNDKERMGQPRNVVFQIILESETSKKEIFMETLGLPPDKTFKFVLRRVKLSSQEGQKAVFHFLTTGDSRAFGFWLHPVIYVASSSRRNIILISLDTLRADHLGCYGYGRPTSPNTDSLARDSAVFLNTFASSPWTLPSHVSIMTALNTINHQVYARENELDSFVHTLAEFLKTKGYFNVAFTGGGYVSGFYGFDRGFDSYRVTARPLARDAAEDLYSETSRWLEDNQDKSFFLFLHTYQIHDPYDSPESYNKLFREPSDALTVMDEARLGIYHANRFRPLDEDTRRNLVNLYDGEIRHTDEALIGPLLEKLRALSLYDRTMIILTSDHGEEFFEHKAWLHTHSVYNEVIKVPLLIKYFGSRYAGRKIEDIVRSVDILPTILEEAGIRYPKKNFDGQSLREFLEEGRSRRDTKARVFISDLSSHGEGEHIPMKIAMNRGLIKFIVNERYSPADLKYFAFPPPRLAETEVFDLSADPGERMNLATARPDLARELSKQLRSLYKQKTRARSRTTTATRTILEALKSLGYIQASEEKKDR